jgi:predicted flap endonuclease-1-like 5' DNA nuclease
MNEPLKTILRVAGVVAGLAAAAWALRDRLVPAPAIPEGPPPRFRTGTEAAAVPEDLTAVKGIGPARAKRLNDAGYQTIAALVEAGPNAVADAAGVTAETAAKWLNSAKAL